MKKLHKMLIIIVILSIFSIKISASGYAEDAINDFKNILTDEQSELISDPDKLTDAISMRAIVSEILSIAEGERGAVLSFLLLCFGCAALIALTEACPSLSPPCQVGVGLVSSVLIFTKLGALFSLVGDSLSEVCNFFSAALPVMTGITLSGGGVAQAGVQAAGMNITVSLLSGAGTTVLLNTASIGLALALLSAFDDGAVSSLSKSLGGFFKWSTGVATASIAAVMSLQSVVASAADSVSMRAAKLAASGMIPVVGGAVSGALSTLASGLSYAKAIVGAGAIWVMLSIALSPLVVMLLYRLALAVAASFSDLLGASGASRILGAYRTALDSLIAVYSLCAVVCIFEVILFMKGGVALL